MLLKYLLVAILFYFIVKTSGNLMRALRGDLDQPPTNQRVGPTASGDHHRTSSGWSTNGQRTSSRQAGWDDDIEDATWEDL